MAAKRQRLVQRRQLVGFSQEALARALRVERSTVVRWESGDTKPQPWLRSRLAQALRVSLDELDELLTTEHDGNTAAGPAAERAVRSPTAQVAEKRSPVYQLPPAVADFTGRQQQITQLTDMLAGRDGNPVGLPIIVITGLPGAGKTALALQVAH